MMLFYFSFFLLVSTCSAIKLSGILCKKGLSADYMLQCQDEPNTPIVFRDMVVLQVNEKDYAFNGKIEFVEVIDEPWKLRFHIKKCKSKENSKTCADFLKFDVDDVCKKLPQENQVWSSFVEDMKLDTHCPLQPNVYDIDDIVIDADSAKFFPVGAGYYKMTIEGFSNEKKLLCVDIAFTITCKK